MVRLAHLGAASRLAAAALVVSVLTGCVGDDDDGAEDVDRPDDTLPAPETLEPVPVDATIPGGTLAGEDDSSIDEVLADGAVSEEELDEAYLLYVECLTSGGGVGPQKPARQRPPRYLARCGRPG